jgi:hypothetical protein
MTAKSAALLFGVIFIIVGILGFVDNPIVGASQDAIFHADSMHNYIHIGSGVLFLLFALAAPASLAGFMILFGIVYLLLGIIGIVNFGTDGFGKLFGILNVNGADNLLHIGLGVLILAFALASRRRVVRV